MKYEFRLGRKDGYLHVRVYGENSAETVARYLKQLYEECKKTGCPNVLVEENLEGAGMDVGEIFGVVSEASKTVWPVLQKMAYVDVNPRHDLRNMKFAETVAVNRSVNVRVFASVQDAENWLVEQLPPPQEKP
jgi:hypothetical protein